MSYTSSPFTSPSIPLSSSHEEQTMPTPDIAAKPLLEQVKETLLTDGARWEKVVAHIKRIQNNEGQASVYDFDAKLFTQLDEHVKGLRALASALAELQKQQAAPPKVATGSGSNVVDATNRFRMIELD